MTATQSLMEHKLQAYAHAFTGKIHGIDAAGIMDIEFSNLVQASRFVAFTKTQLIARIRSDENGVSQTSFVGSVVLQFHTNPKETL